MPRPKKEGAPEPKKRSRNGCWPCKGRKVKCGEEKPQCLNCERQGETCDYSIRLNWGGRTKKKDDGDSVNLLEGATPVSYRSSFSTSEVPSNAAFPSGYVLNQQSAQHQESDQLSHTRAWENSENHPFGIIDPAGADPPQAQLHVRNGADRRLYQSAALIDHRAAPTLSVQDQWSVTSAPIDPRLQGTRFGGDPCPASAWISNPGNRGYDNSSASVTPGSSPGAMLPPLRGQYSANFPAQNSDHWLSPDHRSKRVRLSPGEDRPVISARSSSGATDDNLEPSNSSGTKGGILSLSTDPPTSFSPVSSSVFTPGSSATADDVHGQPNAATTSQPYTAQPEPRRMSVASLLSGPPGEGHGASAEVTTHKRQYPQANTRDNTTTYGYDTGQPDVDVPRNDDINAITLFSPPLSRTYFDFDGNPLSNRDGSISPARSRPVAFERGGYYAKPVPIRISKELEPLPSMLLENPINLLYFHHFLNHTARILVPHDCDQNAFRTVLPQMAVKDPNLLSLLLAFSASHRSRLLSHAEPRTRIAEWVQDVFPNLRQALASEPENITTANLTTAIMLASLEIIAPNTFEVTISWQNHLQVARQMIVGRGGLAKVSRKDKVAYFLSRWFAYLDVLGSLSGRKNDWPLSSAYWSHESVEDEEEDLQIDCFLGFTGRFNGILARIAELAKRVEPLRIDAESNEIREQWRPDADIVEEAAALKEELERSMNGVYRGCSFHHHAPSGSTCAAETGLGSAVPPDSEAEDAWDALELHATNMAFHWAGLVHLNRRVLNLPSSDPAVQDAVREIVGQLYKVRRGGNAEACLVFPMFTAGVEMRWEQWEDIPVAKMKRLEELREMIAERLAALEGVGMGQVNRARTLMQKVWDTGRPWETLSSGEFFG